MREHAEAIRPPRALWVPFPLGRPLGIPNDPAFQQRVVIAALRLLERPSGPVLEDFPEDVPPLTGAEEGEGMACPVNFAQDSAQATLAEQVFAEISQLRVWHDRFLQRQGRTVTGAAPMALEEVPGFIAGWAEDGHDKGAAAQGWPLNELRLACEDLKTFYSEAALAQPGTHTIESVQDWLWGQTAAGKLLFALQATMARSGDKGARFYGENNLVPRRIHYTLGAGRGT